jgi:two-component system OmpR family sensor kinase
MRRRGLIVFIPIVAVLLLATSIRSGAIDNPILFMRADLATLIALSGILLSLAMAVLFFIAVRTKQALHIANLHAQEQAAEERRRFLRRLDHELKNPLTAMRVALANLDDAATSDAREALASVEAQTKRLSSLAADLRKLAELETRPLERSPIDVADLLQQAVSFAQDKPGAQPRRITLTLPHAPWPVPEVSGDQDLLFLVALNLLDNALKFTRDGDTIEVRAFEDGANVVVEVADTGPGIPEDEIPLVWDELYRGQSARGIPGSGLGLALARAIIERHNGQIALRSRIGQGTVVTLRLPIR